MRLALAWLCLLASVTGCTDITPTASAPISRDQTPVTNIAYYAQVHQGEVHFRTLAEQYPGFAGYYFDTSGNLVVASTNLAHRADLLALLQPILEKHRARDSWTLPRNGSVVLKQVPFSFIQLDTWRARLVSDVFPLNGVSYLDLDESRNQIVLGVRQREFQGIQERASAVISRYGIPRGSVMFAVETDDTVISEAETTISTEGAASIRGYQPALVGGLMISRQASGLTGFACTLAFVLEENGGVQRAISNSHCSSQWGATDTNLWGQAGLSSTELFGSEYFDRAWFACGLFDSEKCKNADATLISVGTRPAHTRILANVILGFGSVTIDQSQPERYIQLEMYRSIENDPVEKLGAGTGWQPGHISGTCVSVHVWGNDHALPCQDKATYDASSGDSGAPVFSRNDAVNATIYGIHHSKFPITGTVFFTPMWLIHLDYPSLKQIQQ